MRNIMENRNKSGFTLIEIAIVVVIVAILIAGVMAGEEVLEGSKRMAVVSNLSKYKTAYDQFMEKYYSAPGDMSDAESVWGSTNTNNGDDDGLIDTTAESYLAWQHLALSSFIDGSFAGSRSDTNVVLEVDIPSGPYTKSGYRIIQENQKISTYVNALTFGKVRTGDNVDAGVLTPRQAHIIDQKIDDVNPSEGRLVTTDGNGVTAGTCIVENAGGDQDDEYDLSVTSKSCVILYYLENI